MYRQRPSLGRALRSGALTLLGLGLLTGSAAALSPQWAIGLDRETLARNRAVPFQSAQGGPVVPVVGDELVLKLRADLSPEQAAELLAEYGLKPRRFLRTQGWVHVDLPAPETIRAAARARFGESESMTGALADAIRLIRDDVRFTDVVPNALFRASRSPRGVGDNDSSNSFDPLGADPPGDPSDPLRSWQWNLDLLFSATFDGAPWATEARVAILDSGVAYETDTSGETQFVVHPDLEALDVAEPWDFVGDDEDAYDEFQHGTHIASIIASQSLNSEGVAGIVGAIEIMPVRVLDEDGVGSLADLVAGIEYAVAGGADVINMSLAFPPGYVPGAVLQQAIEDAWDAGLIMVAAAGNESVPAVSYPAVYNEVIAVGALDPNEERADYSNFGLGIDLVAPGGTMEDLDGNGQPDGVAAGAIDYQNPSETGYFLGVGTSQAAAHVSACCAYLKAMTGRSNLDIRVALETTATNTTWSEETGSGMPRALYASAWLSLNAGFSTGLADLPGYVEDYGELPRVLPEGTFGVLMLVSGDLYLVLDTEEGTFGLSAGAPDEVDMGDIESDSLLDIATYPEGGAEGLMLSYGGVPSFISANGGINEVFEYVGGLPDFLDPTGDLLDLLAANGAPLLLVDPDGTIVAELLANGGLIGLMNGNGGLIGHMNGNGQVDAMSGTDGEPLPAIETTGGQGLILIQ